jgi:hypothetical protein
MYCTRSENGRCIKTENSDENDDTCFFNDNTNRCNQITKKRKSKKVDTDTMYCKRSENGRCIKTENSDENDDTCFFNDDTNRCNQVKKQIRKVRKSKKVDTDTMYCKRSENGRCIKTENSDENDDTCFFNDDTNRCNQVKDKKVRKSKQRVLGEEYKILYTKKYSDLTEEEKKNIKKNDMIKIILFFDIIKKNITKQTKPYMYDLIYTFFNENNIVYNVELNELLENCFLNRIKLNDLSSDNIVRECSKKGNISNYVSYIVNEYCMNKDENNYKFKHYHIPYIVEKMNINKKDVCKTLENRIINKETNFNSIQEFYEYTKQFDNGRHILFNNLMYKFSENKKKKVIIQDDKKNLFEIVDRDEYELI